jgi:hypothetical protein
MMPISIRTPCAVLLTCGIILFAQCGDESARRQPVAGIQVEGQQRPSPAAPPAVAQLPVLGERIHVLLSGNMEGKLEPCGCASGQLGGLPRRATYIQEVHGADLLIEGGNLVGGTTPLDLEKAFTAVEVLFGMPTRYDVLGLGPDDLALPLDSWGEYLAAYNAPIVGSDLIADGSKLQPRAFVEKTVRTATVRIASLAMKLPESLAKAAPQQLRLLDPAAGWKRALEGADDATLRVVLVHADPETVRKVVEGLAPRPDLAIGITDAVHEPPAHPTMVGDVPVVFPGVRGRFLVDLHFGRTEKGAAIPQYELVPLRASETKPLAGQDPAVREVLRKHRVFVAEEHLREKMAGQTPLADGLSYVGSARCGECHTKDLELWRNSKHGHAWETLERAEKDPTRYGWPVTQYPDCVACHVVGYGDQSGFASPETTRNLADVGCERCHGAGSAHASEPATRKMGRVGNGTPSVVCTQCHDFEQSPDFDYSTRWPLIEHGKTKATGK